MERVTTELIERAKLKGACVEGLPKAGDLISGLSQNQLAWCEKANLLTGSEHASVLSKFPLINVLMGHPHLGDLSTSGSGSGSGYGEDYGEGSGSGSGYGEDYGEGSGYGSGSGYGYSAGSGEGSGNGYGYGAGDGYGNDYDYGDGSGDGYSYGYGSGEDE